MARYNDNSPVEQTCPLINRVIGYLEGIEGQDSKELQFILDTLEEIREANSTLREWGNDQFKEAEILRKTIKEIEIPFDSTFDEIPALSRTRRLKARIKEVLLLYKKWHTLKSFQVKIEITYPRYRETVEGRHFFDEIKEQEHIFVKARSAACVREKVQGKYLGSEYFNYEIISISEHNQLFFPIL